MIHIQAPIQGFQINHYKTLEPLSTKPNHQYRTIIIHTLWKKEKLNCFTGYPDLLPFHSLSSVWCSFQKREGWGRSHGNNAAVSTSFLGSIVHLNLQKPLKRLPTYWAFVCLEPQKFSTPIAQALKTKPNNSLALYLKDKQRLTNSHVNRH